MANCLRRDLRQVLSAGKVLLVDGGIGSSLRALDTPKDAHSYLDRLNLTHPSAVAEVHRAFISAGVDIITTNTFQANELRCPDGYTVEELNKAAVCIAKQAIRDHVKNDDKNIYILGSVGPLCTGNVDDAKKHYTTQIETLLDAGVDGLLIETITHTSEARVALEIARELQVDIPVIASICLVKDGILPGGESCMEGIEVLNTLAIDAIGINCVDDMDLLVQAITRMKSTMPSLPVYTCPNAGFPDEHGKYSLTCTTYRDIVHTLHKLGVRIIGGCCGVAARHLESIDRDAC
ncbi:hypothetical protein SARC_05366 [Sphaeroforma arctica JP610]|uniref:Hcy-binding domain-containing protein n=1 Tax=Sphaeroforma arctica JP610 TaxID=667725 RepID=A0A0L0G2D5_9EUKA|nr:hypothetical protein SARC_05366 [Sphaeroforma arctica JP610]KNC82353.1 hypothetical protein SARC_05366 [Sphaeroforma arctica JP610]|eukprot:XP_014156255.1 hypothetical protein SARC_05366 [Sphaeroforma arctica JP610]